jgi:hypothetical protein
VKLLAGTRWAAGEKHAQGESIAHRSQRGNWRLGDETAGGLRARKRRKGDPA